MAHNRSVVNNPCLLLYLQVSDTFVGNSLKHYGQSFSAEVKVIIKKGRMPLARLQLRPFTWEGGKLFKLVRKKGQEPVVPQFSLAESAYYHTL